MRPLLAALLAALCACAAGPSKALLVAQARRSGPPPIRVAIDHTAGPNGIDASHDAEIAAAVRHLDKIGRGWTLVADAADADIVVQTMAPDESNECSTLGFWEVGTTVVHVAPWCAPSPAVMRAVVAHELLHAIGGRHICRRPGELPDLHHLTEACSPVGYGRALLNPYIFYGYDQPGCDPMRETCARMVPQEIPTRLDVAEIRRATAAMRDALAYRRGERVE